MWRALRIVAPVPMVVGVRLLPAPPNINGGARLLARPADCKSVLEECVGSTPATPTKYIGLVALTGRAAHLHCAGCRFESDLVHQYTWGRMYQAGDGDLQLPCGGLDSHRLHQNLIPSCPELVTAPTVNRFAHRGCRFESCRGSQFKARVAQLGERCPYKAEATGSRPVLGTTNTHGGVTQLAEYSAFNRAREGSSPSTPTKTLLR